MASIINTETFIPADVHPEHGYWIEGTVEVTLRGETRRVPATKSKLDGLLTAYGMTGRYQTGTKAWPAHVTQRISPRTNKVFDDVWFGRDDRAGRFQKTNALHFA